MLETLARARRRCAVVVVVDVVLSIYLRTRTHDDEPQCLRISGKCAMSVPHKDTSSNALNIFDGPRVW